MNIHIPAKRTRLPPKPKRGNLTIEMIPSTSHFTNLRSLLPQEEWDRLRRDCYKNAKYHCEICGSHGTNHPVECHEVWSYNIHKRKQTLRRLIALCPKCHRVKHLGRTKHAGKAEYDQAFTHFMLVNNISKKEAERRIIEAIELYKKRSSVPWEIDISLVTN